MNRKQQMELARAGRVERELTPEEHARIRALWGCADARVSAQEIARMMGVSVYAVKQSIAGKKVAIYRGASGFDVAAYAKDNSRVNQRIQQIVRAPR